MAGSDETAGAVGADVLDDLYGGAPDDFVARRDAAARAARSAGDRDLARRIGALRKPTAAAALVNALMRDDPGLAGRVVALGDALREAERTLDGPGLRDLSTQRRTLVRALVARARELGGSSGQRVGDAVAQEVDATLTAALADPGIAQEVTSGHLAAGREYSGFGAFGGGSADDSGVAVAATPSGAGGSGSVRSAGGSLRRVPRGRLTVADEPKSDDPTAESGSPATAKTAKATTPTSTTAKTKAAKKKARTAAEPPAGSAAGDGTTGDALAERRARKAADQRRRVAESARDAAVDARDRARKAADRVTARRDERRADLDEASATARAAHDLHDELMAAVTDLRRRIAKADKDAVRAEDRLAKAERALHDEERAAISVAQDLRRAEKALQAADRAVEALDGDLAD